MIINYLHNALPGYRAYVLMCLAAIIFIGTKKSLRKKRVELPQDWFGIHQHGRRFIVLEHQWLPWRHVDTLYKYCLKCENFSLLGISFFVYFYYCLCLCLFFCLFVYCILDQNKWKSFLLTGFLEFWNSQVVLGRLHSYHFCLCSGKTLQVLTHGWNKVFCCCCFLITEQILYFSFKVIR